MTGGCLALYEGDELVMVGTARELAEARGVKEATIRFYASPAYRRRVAHAKAPVLAIRCGQGEEDTTRRD